MNYNYKCACSKDKLSEIRSFVSEVLHKHGISDVQISTLVLAVDEVCANLIIHGHKNNPEDFIELAIKITDDNEITFDIIDEGDAFDISNYSEPTLGEIIRRKRKGGVGLILVRKIMDDIKLINNKGHNICRLVKKIDPPSS